MQLDPLISFIILTWNSDRFIHGCFESIINKCKEEKICFEIIVIDNGSVDGSIQVIELFQKKYLNQIILIPLDSNRGTTYPRNLGLKIARGEIICILDSDTELEKGALSAVINRLMSDRGVGMVVPRLLLPDGVVQNSVKRFPTMLNKLMKIPHVLMGVGTVNSDFYGDFPFKDEREVDTAISACWFFKKILLLKVGFLDEKIFYAPEDVDYSVRVWQAGYRIIYSPVLTVLHHTQQITHRKPISRISMSHLWGLLYYFKKHGGWFSTRLLRSELRQR